MTKELPKRPEPDPRENQIIDPTDRVKSVADKVDPKFEAARARADREAELRARTGAKSDTPEVDDTEADAGDGDTSSAPKAPFSFNRTAGDAEEEQ